VVVAAGNREGGEGGIGAMAIDKNHVDANICLTNEQFASLMKSASESSARLLVAEKIIADAEVWLVLGKSTCMTAFGISWASPAWNGQITGKRWSDCTGNPRPRNDTDHQALPMRHARSSPTASRKLRSALC
jgi:hypothetical protein